MDFVALWLTLRLAVGTTAILLVIALPLAWWIASGRGAGRAIVQAVVALPLVLPPTVLGFYLLVALGPLSAPGRLLIRIVGHPLAFSFAGLLVGSVIYSLPFAVQPLVAGFAAVDHGYVEAAAGWEPHRGRRFGESCCRWPGFAADERGAHVYPHRGEFGVVLMLGGNIPGATQTLSIALYDRVQEFNYASANRTALVLVAVSLAALLVIYSRRGERLRGELV